MHVDRDDEVLILRIPRHCPLASNDIDDEVLIQRPMLSCLSSSSHPFVCPRPATQVVDVADALLGMVNTTLLLLFTPSATPC
jgi:hypothetical protein